MVPSQQMRLEQRLTAQLIQSMEILQLPLAALEARIRSELESNPVLEEAEREPTLSVETPTESPPASEANTHEAESFERLEQMSRALELDPGDLPFGRGRGSAGERDSKLDAMANTATRGESLSETLLAQWKLVDASEPVKKAGHVLIDWMDEDGYLRTGAEHHPRKGNGDTGEATPLIIRRTNEETEALMDEIAHSRTPPIDADVLDEALVLVQSLEPTGVGARDLTECLLIQLDHSPECDELQAELVREHLVDLAKNKFPEVARRTGRLIEEIKAALRSIGKLNHHPGLLVRPSSVPKVTPDILVDYAEDGDGYTVRLARGNNPRLQISSSYRQLLSDKSQDKQAREFIKKRIEAASTLIDAIHYRRDRLLEIGRIIVERQREFFDFGPQFLKVLYMRDLAEELGCDSSTISRTVDDKYLQCPRGIYPLRIFFTGGFEDASGVAVSWDAVKAQVKEVIDAEDKNKPLRDDEVAAIMEERGVKISRRTVAKYRSQLNIPTYQLRKGF
jgi:RNA polymerase sigma-54 factor